MNKMKKKFDFEQELGNLLARIHGDGGHYIGKNGWEKAVKDADDIIVKLQYIEDAGKRLAEAAETKNRKNLYKLNMALEEFRFAQNYDSKDQ